MTTFSAPAVEQPGLFTAPAAAPDEPPAPAFRGTAQRHAPTGITPTPEQVAIRDAYARGEHITIEALAGTGKTSSLRLIAAEQPRRPGAYIAYNKAIADEAAGKFPDRVLTGTAHSFAYGAVGRAYAHRLPARHGRESSSRRMTSTQVAEQLRLRDTRIGHRHIDRARLAKLAEATVKRFCESADLELTAQHVPYTPGIERPADVAELAAAVLPAARAMWADIRDPQGRLWFQHDHYLKMWQLSGPRLGVDYILFDEAQDANPLISAIVAAQDHAQLIYVGDRNQQLYAWRGAVDAMASFEGTRLPLTRSFRFGPAVAEVANGWLRMLGCDLRVEGAGGRSTVGPEPGAAAVLCRTNGGAMGEVLHAQQAGRKVSLVGDGVEIRSFAFAARKLMAGQGCDLPELAAFRTWRQLQEYVEEEESGRDLQVLVKLVNRYGPATLIDAVGALVPTKQAQRADLIVSTAHRAKGLEWPSVRIAGDFAPPLDGDPPERAELMLAYVAVTRAQRRLDRGSLDWPGTGALDAAGRWQSYETEREET